MRAARTPCASCPWWKTSPGGSVIPGFSIDKARGLACTVGPGDDTRSVMACHGSAEGKDTACVGYLIVEGWSNLRVRLAAIVGDLPYRSMVEATDPDLLHPSFADMLAALEAAEAPNPEETPQCPT